MKNKIEEMKDWASDHKGAIVAGIVTVAGLALVGGGVWSKMDKEKTGDTLLSLLNARSKSFDVCSTLLESTKLKDIAVDWVDVDENFINLSTKPGALKLKELDKLADALCDLPDVSKESEIWVMTSIKTK